ncbi:kinase-like domain-containing protein [Mycena rebaudengoi]|nr:kinase-like domain-containing protein [Mycena rebaudengoi]
MSPSEVECCFKQILCGVGYLHSQGVAHRDIKAENLFFDTGGHLKRSCVRSRFGGRDPPNALFSYFSPPQPNPNLPSSLRSATMAPRRRTGYHGKQQIHMSTGLCGSKPYIAPEQFLDRPYDARLVDIWSDALYAAAAMQTPPPPLAAALPASSTSSSATAANSTSTSTSTAHASSSSSTHTANASNSNSNSNNMVFPPTISNLSPRACRLLLRKMLEPDPKLRRSIEEVLGYAWMRGVEVCWEVGGRGAPCACECARDGGGMGLSTAFLGRAGGFFVLVMMMEQHLPDEILSEILSDTDFSDTSLNSSFTSYSGHSAILA